MPNQTTALMRENNRLFKALIKSREHNEIVRDTIISAISRLRPPKILKAPKTTGDPESAGLIISDTHFGEKVLPVDTLGHNKYTMAEAERRINLLTEKVIKLTKSHRRITPLEELVIFCLGDFVTGECVFRGQAHRIDAPVISQYILGANFIAYMVNRFSALYSKIRLECVCGNHGRPGLPGMYDERSSWDFVIYNQIKEQLKNNPRVIVNIHEGAIGLVKVQNQMIGISHGHNLGRGCLLETAMMRAATNWPDLLRHKLKGKRLTAALIGHYHSAGTKEVGSVEVIANGSLVGGTSYAVNKIRTVNEPIQWFFGIHRNRLSWRYKIDFKNGKH